MEEVSLTFKLPLRFEIFPTFYITLCFRGEKMEKGNEPQSSPLRETPPSSPYKDSSPIHRQSPNTSPLSAPSPTAPCIKSSPDPQPSSPDYFLDSDTGSDFSPVNRFECNTYGEPGNIQVFFCCFLGIFDCCFHPFNNFVFYVFSHMLFFYARRNLNGALQSS